MFPIEESKGIIFTRGTKSATDGLADRRLKSQNIRGQMLLACNGA